MHQILVCRSQAFNGTTTPQNDHPERAYGTGGVEFCGRTRSCGLRVGLPAEYECATGHGAHRAGRETAARAHPNTPILLVEDRNIQTGFLVEARRKGNESNHAALRESFAALKAEEVAQIYYLEGANLLGDDGEGTVDGSHPTDLGFTRQAAEFELVMRPILK
jgi:GDSL-like Lipase/Acylhydrolase family